MINLATYYQAYNHYFWQWEEDGDVLAVTGGSTIGYRQQVAEILIGLAENGLPPFGSILLVIIASNVTLDDSVTKAENILIKTLVKFERAKTTRDEIFLDSFAFLRILSSLPAEYKTGKRKQILLQTLLANCHNRIKVTTSKVIANDFLTGFRRMGISTDPVDFSEPIMLKELRAVALLKRKFPTPEAIIGAMGDLPELEEDLALPDNISVSEKSYEDFVEELLENPRTFEIAALIRPIWAGFKIPIFNAHPSEQPLGGVSDLSNKGDFDKLLISEFANDDILFMNRVANNEALYLHREMPPVKDDLHRTILIDVSLKCWGTPKMLAMACYIAIARHPRANTQSKAYVLGQSYNPVSCNGASEIIDMLQHTEASLHPGDGLAAFLKDNRHDKALEIFYITTPEALKHHAVQKQLAEHHAFLKYIITTEAAGVINFYRNRKNALQLLQTIRLPLERLWTKKISGKPLQPLPPVVVESAQKYVPLLLPVPRDIKSVLPIDQDLCYYIANKCLLKHKVIPGAKTARGLELVLRNVPGHCLYEVGIHKDGNVLFLLHNPHSHVLSITNLDTLQIAKTTFLQWDMKKYREFLFYENESFIYLKQKPQALKLLPDFETGIITIEDLDLPSVVFDLNYAQRQEVVGNRPNDYVPIDILKNVSKVYINREHFLVFNEHKLVHQSGGGVNFTKHTSTSSIAETTRKGNKREFDFKDGSKVLVDPIGYIQLISSNPAIPAIYITATPRSIPGLATLTCFAGSEIFYNKYLGKVGVRIMHSGIELMACIRIIRESTFIALWEIKQVLDSAPALLPSKIDLYNAEKMVKKLANNGCSAIIEKTHHSEQDIISPEKFYQENIALFISHIIDNEPAG